MDGVIWALCYSEFSILLVYLSEFFRWVVSGIRKIRFWFRIFGELGFGTCWERSERQQEEPYRAEAHPACCEERRRAEQASWRSDHRQWWGLAEHPPDSSAQEGRQRQGRYRLCFSRVLGFLSISTAVIYMDLISLSWHRNEDPVMSHGIGFY